MDIENLDLGKLFRIIKRYLFLIIGCAVGCAVIAILYTVFLITPKYQSYATLIVNNNNSSSLSDGSTITNDQINSAKQLVDTYSVILKSESVMDKVITSLNLRAREGMTDITATSLANMVVDFSGEFHASNADSGHNRGSNAFNRNRYRNCAYRAGADYSNSKGRFC